MGAGVVVLVGPAAEVEVGAEDVVAGYADALAGLDGDRLDASGDLEETYAALLAILGP